MTRVLIITGILPVSLIEYKKTENDIILVTEDRIKERCSNISFEYIFTFPFANKILSKFSPRWNSYYTLKQQSKLSLRGRLVTLFPILILPKKVFFRNILLKISMFMNRKRLANIIKEFKPTILHAQCTDSSAFIAKRLSEKYNIPYIITLRGINEFSDNRIKANLNSALSLIALSPLQVIEGEKLTRNHIDFIPHGINEGFFIELQKIKTLSSPIRLILVSRLMKLKNIDMVIRALSMFRKDFIFDIYGEGPEKSNLEKLIVELGLQHKITLKGFISNEKLPFIFKNYDLFIMCSFPETLGRVYFEAMACGLPVIASKNTGIDGLITEGKEGFLIDTSNKQEFSNKLKEILEKLLIHPSLIEDLSINARKYSNEYSWNNIVPKLLLIYEKK